MAISPFVRARPLAEEAVWRFGVELDDDCLQRIGGTLAEALEIEVLPDRRPAAGRLRCQIEKAFRRHDRDAAQFDLAGWHLGRWLDGVDVEHFTTRDIRRTWKSRAHDAGIDRYTRDLIQQHAKSDTGSVHYDWANYLPQMTEAMGKWNDWLAGIINGAPVIKIAA